MNLQQLDYIVALEKHRHFAKAADACFVTQATLSVMIKKLEEELNVILFDRSKQPVVPTELGKAIIEQSKVVLREASLIQQLSKENNLETTGELRLGIIPTLAPYLLPLFLPSFLKNYPGIKLKIQEHNTEQLLQELADDKLDTAILATPIRDKSYGERFLFLEPFSVLVSSNEKILRKKYILAEDLDVNRLWLLEEGHCLRTQVLNLCELQKQQAHLHQLDYETGSIESLIKITDINKGITIIPELATIDFNPKLKERLRYFKPPVPVREISLVTYRHFVKKNLLDGLEKEIKQGVEPFLNENKKSTQVIPIDMN